jgi:hypothetical protein
MGISGTYKTGANSPMGRIEGLMILRTEGEALTGTMTGMGNAIEFQNGKVSGDDFEFEVTPQTPMGSMTITVKGTVDGDRISGNFITGFGQMPFEGTREE